MVYKLSMPNQHTALCQSGTEKNRGRLAICAVLLIDGVPPEWIMLVPAGKKVKCFDGREYSNSRPQDIVDAFEADSRDVPIDWEHAQEIKAPKGEPAPASGWVVAMEVRDGAVWGRVEWTPKGVDSLSTKEYKYLSPAFYYDKAKVILQIISAGLVNRPAFDMPVLASDNLNKNPENEMDPKILKLLGLADDATPEQVLEAITALKFATTESEKKVVTVTGEVADVQTKLETTEADLVTAREKIQPITLDKFVPRGDYDAMVIRATAAETKLKDGDAVTFSSQVDTEIKAALAAGKITPATEKFYRDGCTDAAKLEGFKTFCKDAAVIGDPSKLHGKKTPVKKGDEVAITAEQKAIIAKCGLTPAQFATGVDSTEH